MALIKSISGIRGTIGGAAGHSLTPPDIVKYASAFAQWVRKHSTSKKIVIGRDARISGKMVSNLVTSTLQSLGIEVIDLGLSTTPTVEMAVPKEKAGGGIILTASHNPKQWNALKLLNEKGEFLSASDGDQILKIAELSELSFAMIDDLGDYIKKREYIDYHINEILKLPLVDKELIQSKNFKVIVDGVNSTGGIAVPALLEKLGVSQIEKLFCEPTGEFPHNPEPLPENLTEISSKMRSGAFDLGIVVDPDVDRLAFLNEDGSLFGEEYTLVAVADYILKNKKGPAVSNLSSTRALRDVCTKHGVEYHASAVGEVNVVEKMKAINAVIGGEGNGGIIYPDLHYGRDALVGIALFLTHLAQSGKNMTELKAGYPPYHISKNKIELTPAIDVDDLLIKIKSVYKEEDINDIDGVKIDFDHGWVHLRKSNTEPIIRIYSEAKDESSANQLAEEMKGAIGRILG
ncbi:MAG: phosphoglucosamine mutase [Cyclobacteriaceae bacterium]